MNRFDEGSNRGDDVDGFAINVCKSGALGRAHRSHRWGAGVERAQWAMRRGGGVLSKGASQAAVRWGDHCEVDRTTGAAPDLSDQPSAVRRSRTDKPEGFVALRDHRFESCCDHQNPRSKGLGLYIGLVRYHTEGVIEIPMNIRDQNEGGVTAKITLTWLFIRLCHA